MADKKAPEKKKKHAGHGFTHSTVEHHGDGSHTVTHHHEDGPQKDVKHAVGDHDAMMDSMMQHTSQPNPGEDMQAAPVAPASMAAPAAAGPAGPAAPPAGPMGA
jgi:hypothetical protein